METEQIKNNDYVTMRNELLSYSIKEMIRQNAAECCIAQRVEMILEIWDKNAMMPDQEPATPQPVMVDDPVGSTWIPTTADSKELYVWRKIKHVTMTVGNATAVFALCECDGIKTQFLNWIKSNALFDTNKPKDSRGHYVLATSAVVDALLDLNPLRFRNVLEYAQRINEIQHDRRR